MLTTWMFVVIMFTAESNYQATLYAATPVTERRTCDTLMRAQPVGYTDAAGNRVAAVGCLAVGGPVYKTE